MTTPRTIVVVRHGKSSWKTNDPDIGRPLSSRGTRDAVVAGQQLARLTFDVALVSPATRAQQSLVRSQLRGDLCGGQVGEIGVRPRVVSHGVTPQPQARGRTGIGSQ